MADPGGRMRGMHPSPTGTHSAPKLSILRSKIEKKILGRGHSPLPRPLPRGEGVPLPTPSRPSASRLRPHTPPPTISGSATVSEPLDRFCACYGATEIIIIIIFIIIIVIIIIGNAITSLHCRYKVHSGFVISRSNSHL